MLNAATLDGYRTTCIIGLTALTACLSQVTTFSRSTQNVTP